MPRITEYTTGKYKVDSKTISVYMDTLVISGDNVGIRSSSKQNLIDPVSFDQWIDPSGNPYASLELLLNDLKTFFFDIGNSGESKIEIGVEPPTDNSKLWFNTNDQLLYFFDSDWLSSQIYETIFNDQGSTPNNTFLRVGNTVTNSNGVGYNVSFESRVLGLSFTRNLGTVQPGQFSIFSNRDTGSNNANIICNFIVDNSARGFVEPDQQTDININNYIAMRWSGSQTNNNIVTLQYRKIYS